jgi:carboxypeptidase family protein
MSIIRTNIFCVLLMSAAAWAQTAQINGIIKDSSGLAIPGAAIKATQTATGVVRTATSSDNGNYALPNLPVGPYMLEVTKEGFNKYVQSGIVLQVDTNPTIDVPMQVGSVSSQVTVEAAALQVETRTTSIGQVVDNQRIMEMPLNGRDVHELIFLAGMAKYPGTASLQSVRNYPTVVVSVAGGAPDSVGYSLDGIIHQDPYNNLSLPLPFPDAVQEFKVETSAIPAQYGFHSTAAVNAITKSGTNEFHGDLFEFLRNGKLNANDYFNNASNKPRDTLKRNQFGGVIGGPVRKDKLFFFGGYQRTSLRSDGTQQTAFIPTPAMASGDFTGIASGPCNNGTPVNLPASLGFSNNKLVSPSSLNSVSLNIFKTLPATADPCGRTTYSLLGNQDEDLITGKVDYQVNEKHTIFGRVTSAKLNVGSTYDGVNPLSLNTYALNDFDYGVALGDTWVISPRLVNSLRVGANRTNVVKLPDKYRSWSALGANITPISGDIIALNVSGAFTVAGANANPGQSHNGPLWSVVDDFNWVRGSHQIAFGGSLYRQMLNYWSGVNGVGSATFATSASLTPIPLVNFMLGFPTAFSQGTNYGFYSRQYYGALYIQDSWKISRRLTANYGVRWEPYTSVYQKYDHQDLHFDPALFAQNVRSSFYKNSPAGLVFSGDPQYGCGNSFNCPKWNKFFPRVGLAWDPKGDGRMTVRVAYGMFGDRMSMLSLSQEQFAAPFGNTVAPPISGVSITNPWVNYGGLAGGASPAGQNPMPILAALSGFGAVSPNIPFPAAGRYVSSPLDNFNPMYVNQWNLNIQKQFGKDWLVTANYLGTSTIHFPSNVLVNPAVYIPGSSSTPTGCAAVGGLFPRSCTANQESRRVLAQINPQLASAYSAVGTVDDGGTANYEGLYLSVQKRLGSGVTANANYSYGHCISDPWGQNPTADGVAIPGNRREWRSSCPGTDVRQLFRLNMVATTPKFSNRALRLLASNWQVAPNMEIRSAQLFTVTVGSDTALTTVGAPTPQNAYGFQTPDLVNLNPYPSNQGVDHWINKSAFAPAATGTYGNLGYSNLKGPGVFQLNLALSRNFAIREKQLLQVRAEAFNLPNHLNPFTPGLGPLGSGYPGFGGALLYTSSNFGQITNDISGNSGLQGGDYRVVQLALKFIF